MRLLLKLSGEVLGGRAGLGLDPEALSHFADTIAALAQKHEVAIVTGGGNIMRGKTASGLDRAKADQIGMMATVVNCMTLAEYLVARKCNATAMSSVASLARPYDITAARQLLANRHVVLVAGGTSNPYFTTDTAAALRACEINAQAMLKATQVDGVYDSDPRTNPNAKRFEVITHKEVLEKELHVMDSTAAALLKDNGMPIIVFNLHKQGNIARVLRGENIGTIVK